MSEETPATLKKNLRRTVGKDLANLELPPAQSSESEVRDELLERVDREHIDNIVLSTDVQSGGKIRVTRKGPYDRDFQWVCNIPAEQWKTDTTFEYLKTMYGGGDYECKTFRANGQMYKPFSFSIDHRYKGRLDEDEIKRLAPDSGGKTVGSDLVRMFELMRQDKPKDDGLKSGDLMRMMEMSANKSDQMMMLMMQLQSKSSENMMQMITVMMSAVAGKSTGIDPVLLEMLKAKTEKTPVLELLEMMKAIKELNAEPKPEPEPEKPFWEKLLTQAAPVLLGSLGGGMTPQPASQPQVAAPQETADPTQIDQNTAAMLENFAVRMFLNKVLVAATENKDPALYADLISEMLSPVQMQTLRQVLTQTDWAVKLFSGDARVQSCMVWLTELKELLLQDVPQPEQSSTATTTGGSPPVQPQQ